MKHPIRSATRLGVFIAMLATVQGFAAEDGAKSPDSLWTYHAVAPAPPKANLKDWIRSDNAAVFTLDTEELRKVLADAPREFTPKANNPVIFSLPTPDGDYMRFEAIESPIWEPGFELTMPDTMTYKGQCLDDPTAHIRFDWTPAGFHASVMSAEGTWFVDPYWQGDTTTYSAYYKRDFRAMADDFRCLVEGSEELSEVTLGGEKIVNGATLRTYRAAVAATVEYTAFHGGTAALGQAAIVTAMNRVNQVYEAEVALRMNLVANNINLVYVTAPDPYTNSNGATMLGENQTNVNTVIGSANYDIGHVFSTGGGGIASLNSPCTANKAQGVTGSPSPTGDPFWIDYVAHEMGHQWGGNHTFNGTGGNCSGANRNAATAYEIGSGSTIQAYAGICAPDDLQSNSDAYFHSLSLDEIVANITSGSGSTCDVPTATGNTPPTVNAGGDFTIPIGTPFTVTAAGSDANGDTITYCWEQRDLGAAQALAAADNGTSPIFRSFTPTTSPSRTFPRLSNIIANVTTNDEKYPAVARTLDLRCVVRDNRAGGGGIGSDDMVINVNAGAGPFLVTAPNTAVTWTTSPQTVTWNVANTTAAPVSTANVNILLSTDGGNTFPTILLANTPNDGSQSIALPTVNSTQCRIKVEAAGNIYWDMSNANFTINYAGGAAVVTNVTSPSLDGTYISGTIPIQVTFNAPVQVSGSPLLALNTTPARNATYASGSGSSTLTFNYNITAGDFSTDLDYASGSALTLNGGTIRDNATNTIDALLSLATPGATGSLGFSKNIAIGASLSIADASLTEGNSGTSNMTFTVTLAPANPGPGNVTVDYSLAGVSATAGTDFNATGGTVTFTTGQSTRPINVPINGDNTLEPNETFTVTLSNSSGPTIATASATGTILNDDYPNRFYGVSMESSAAANNEGFLLFDPSNPGPTASYFVNADMVAIGNAGTVMLGGDFAGTDRSVFYTMTRTTVGGTETLYRIDTASGATLSTSTIALPSPATGGQFLVGMKWDTANSRMVVCTMDTTGAAAMNRRLRLSSVNNLTSGAASLTQIVESQTGIPQTTDLFLGFAYPSTGTTAYVLRSPAAGGTGAKTLYSIATGTGNMTSVGSVTVGGSATALETYYTDLAFDAVDNTLYLSAYAATTFANNLYRLGAVGTPGLAATLITNMDVLTPSNYATISGFTFARLPAGTVQLSVADAATITEGNSGTQNISFAVTKTGANVAAVTVDWAITGINASDTASALSGSLNFPISGSNATQNVVIAVSGDTTWETNEQVLISLSNNSVNSLVTDGSGVSQVNNDDAPVGGYAFGYDQTSDGLFLFDPTSLAGTFSRSAEVILANSIQGGTFAGTDQSTFYALDFTAGTLNRINTTTGVVSSSTAITGFTAGYTQMLGIAWDQVAGVTRVMTRNGTTGAVRLNTINLTTAVLTPTGADLTGIPANTILLSLASDPSTGTLYSLAIGGVGFTDSLCSINTGTSVVTPIGSGVGFDVTGTFFTDMAFRPSTGVLYWTGFSGTDFQNLYTLNTTTGVATSVSVIESTLGIFQSSALGFVPAPPAPSIVLSSAAGDPVNGAITVTATISAAPDGGTFTSADVTPTNATVSGFAGGGTSWSWTLTPTAQGLFSCVVNASTFTSGGNNNTASNTLSRTFDSIAPTISLASAAGDPVNGAITVTATLSEAPAGGSFTSADVTPTNATVSAFAGGGTSWSWTLTPTAQGLFSCVVNAGQFNDGVNNNTASNTLSRTFDSVGPTISLASAAGDPVNGAITVTATLSEAPAGGTFTSADVTPTNATVSAFAGAGTSWSWTLTPTAQGLFSCIVNAGTFTDATSNPNTVSNSLSRTFDSVAPTISLASAAGDPVNGAITVTATLSEAPAGGSFTSGDVTPTNATVSAFAGGGTSWSWTLTPTAQGLFSCVVNAGQFNDGVNNNTASNTLSRTFDSVGPTISLASAAGDPVNGAITVTATLSEAPAGGTFTSADVTPTNATVSAFAGGGTSWSWTLTPTAQGLFSCIVNAGTFTDAATNPNTVSNSLSRTFDSVGPTVVLASAAGDPVNGAITVTATLSEAPAGGTFTSADVTPTNATVSAFAGAGTSWSWTLTPTAQGLFSCIVNAGTFTDATSNPNTVSNSLSRTFDSVGPTISLASAAGDPVNGAITVTATLSEAPAGGTFTSADVTPTNATVSAFAGGGTSWSWTLTPTAQGLFSCIVNAGTFTDATSNPNTVSNTLSRTFDSVGPTISLASAAGDPVNGAITVTATLSEAPAGGTFTSADVTPTNATVSAFAGGGTSWSWTLTPTAQGVFSCIVNASTFVDAASNPNSVSNSLSRTFDSVGPTVVLSSAASDPVNGAITVTATLSEAPAGGSFTSADVTPTNATVSAFAGGGTSWSWTLTPTAQGVFSCIVNASTFVDAASNPNSVSNSLSRTFDSVQPGVSMSSVASEPTNTSPIPVTVTFTESVTGFVAGDIVASNATVGGFAGSGASYSFNLFPSAAGIVTADIAAGVAQDAAGNPNTVSAQFFRTYNNVNPTVTMSSVAPNPTNTSPIPVTVTFSASMTGFTSGDITATNGTVGGFAGSGANYSFNLTPSGQGTVTADIAAGVAIDGATNPNEAAPQFSRVFDTVAPTIALSSAAGDPVNGAITVTATLSEAPAGGTFTSADVTPTNATVSAFAGAGTSWSWTLTPTAQGAFSCIVNAGTFTDAATNPNTVSNSLSRTFDSVAPTIALSSAAGDPVSAAITVTATLSEAPATGTFTSADVTPTNATVSAFAGAGTSWSWTLTPTAQGAFSCIVNAGTFTDAATNPNTVSNSLSRTFDSVAPTIALSSAAGDPVSAAITVTATLSEAPAVGTFTSADVTPTNATVSAFAGAGTSWSWTLTPTAQGAFSCIVNAGTFTDAATNPNTVSNSLSRTFDSVGPTIVLSSAAGDPVNAAITVTATLNEAPAVGTFTSADVTPTNATVSAFAGAGTSWSWTLTPTAQGVFSCIVNAGTFTDATSNANSVSNSLSRTFDSVAPNATLSTLAPDPTNAAFSVSVVLGEASTNFVSGDLTAVNGSVSAFSGSGTAYSFTFTPSAQGAASVEIAAGAFTDAAGNNNTASNLLTRTFDSIAPTSSASAVADPTRVGTSLSINFTAADASTVNTNLWVRAPGSGSFVDTGSTAAGTSGSLGYTATLGVNGLYEFATRATDAAGNSEAAPVTADTSVLLNTLANGAFTQTTTAASQLLVFPMTDALDMTIQVNSATIGGQVTMSRTTPLGAAPAGLNASRLINEFLTITEAGLGASWTADLTWNFDPTSDDSLVGTLNTVFQFEGGSQINAFPVTPVGDSLGITGITDFSEWYAGNNDTSVEEWMLFDIAE